MSICINPLRMERALIIQKSIIQAEQDYVSKNRPECLNTVRRKMFFTNEPRTAVYGSTREDMFALTLEVLPIPRNCDFVDLGAGFGGVTFTAGMYFNGRSIGIELSPGLYNAALALMPELDFTNRVSFWNKDFLKEDLSRFGVVHIYEPFWEDLAEELERKFGELLPGTVVIPHLAPRVINHALPPENFERILPEDPARAPSTFMAFMRL